MKVAMFRVGIDTGSGGIHGPIFADGQFEFIPIQGKDSLYTYGNTWGRHGRRLVDYFPRQIRERKREAQVHFDPEFNTFTYGDPNKKTLAKLSKGDLLVFYAGLEGWGDCDSEPAIYLIGYFVVDEAVLAKDCSQEFIEKVFAKNAHVRTPERYVVDKDRMVLVKGNEGKSRLLEKAIKISEKRENKAGNAEDCLSTEMTNVFGGWGRMSSLKRNTTHWLAPAYAEKAREFVLSL
jgi:hypothetical protein